MSTLRPERAVRAHPTQRTAAASRGRRYRAGRRRSGRGEGVLLLALLAIIVAAGFLLTQQNGSGVRTLMGADEPGATIEPDAAGVVTAPPAVLPDGTDAAARAANLAIATYAAEDVTEAWLARDDLWIGALLSAPSQGQGVPLLLTDPETLSPPAAAALEQLGVQRVRILGGAMSSGVERAVRDLGYEVARVDGSSRAEVAVRVAQLVRPDADTALLVNGADRGRGSGQPPIGREIAVASYAAAEQLPVLATWRDLLPQVTMDYLTGAGITRVQVVGGPQVIADAVLDQLRAAGVAVERLEAPSGADLAAQLARQRGLTPSGEARVTVVDIGNGDAPAWGAGLAAAGYSARANAPVVFVEGNRLPSATLHLLHNLFRSAAVTCAPNVSVEACDAVRSLARSGA